MCQHYNEHLLAQNQCDFLELIGSAHHNVKTRDFGCNDLTPLANVLEF